MKNITLLNGFILILLTVGVSSCSAITGIFKAGMDVGIFAVLAVVVLIVGIVIMLRKKNRS